MGDRFDTASPGPSMVPLPRLNDEMMPQGTCVIASSDRRLQHPSAPAKIRKRESPPSGAPKHLKNKLNGQLQNIYGGRVFPKKDTRPLHNKLALNTESSTNSGFDEFRLRQVQHLMPHLQQQQSSRASRVYIAIMVHVHF